MCEPCDPITSTERINVSLESRPCGERGKATNTQRFQDDLLPTEWRDVIAFLKIFPPLMKIVVNSFYLKVMSSGTYRKQQLSQM